jgi:1,4-dihydroxy-2-naphthoyl-CoA hydrolase
MAFSIEHPVRFHETDGAGVVYFANGLVMCHMAYEASLAAAGLDLVAFFQAETVAYPVVHTAMDYRRPMICGDVVCIQLVPTRLDQTSFEVTYTLTLVGRPDSPVAEAITRHVAIETQTRRRCPLPPAMEQWIERWRLPA